MLQGEALPCRFLFVQPASSVCLSHQETCWWLRLSAILAPNYTGRRSSRSAACWCPLGRSSSLCLTSSLGGEWKGNWAPWGWVSGSWPLTPPCLCAAMSLRRPCVGWSTPQSTLRLARQQTRPARVRWLKCLTKVRICMGRSARRALSASSNDRLHPVGCEGESNLSMWIYVLLGNVLRGIGETPVQPLGISYIDDFATEENAALYVGMETKCWGTKSFRSPPAPVSLLYNTINKTWTRSKALDGDLWEVKLRKPRSAFN